MTALRFCGFRTAIDPGKIVHLPGSGGTPVQIDRPRRNQVADAEVFLPLPRIFVDSTAGEVGPGPSSVFPRRIPRIVPSLPVVSILRRMGCSVLHPSPCKKDAELTGVVPVGGDRTDQSGENRRKAFFAQRFDQVDSPSPVGKIVMDSLIPLNISYYRYLRAVVLLQERVPPGIS